MARQIGYGALTVTDVTDGINNATIYLYHRYPDTSDNDITQGTTGHELPLNNALEYNFTTGRLSSIHGDNDDFRGWTQTIPNGTDAIYVTTAVATSVENTYIIPSWSIAVKLATNGTNGVDGADGLSVKAVRELYYFKRTTDSNPQDLSQITPTPTIYTDTEPGHWTSKTPSYLVGGTYYTCIETTLSDNTKAYSSPVVNEALTDANNNAAIARSIAQANEENAQGALAISQGLESRLRYIWVNLNEPSLPSDDTNTNAYLGGTYAASGIDGTTFVSSNPSTYGFNSLLRHTKLMFRYNGIALTTIGLDGLKLFAPLITNNVITGHQLSIKLTGGSAGVLNFYNPKTGKVGLSLNKDNITFYKHDSTTAAATLNGTGLNIAAGGIKGGTANQSGFIYLSTENYGNYSINNSSGITDWKEIIGTKFGVRADGTLYANSAIISGTLTAGAGSKIGPWFINDSSISRNSGGTAAGSYNTASNMYFGTSGISLGTAFKVSAAGALTATGATIEGGITTSNIKATGGTIGGWSISSGALSRLADKNGNTVSADKAKFYVYIQSSSGTDGGNYAFALRSRTDAQVTANSPAIGSADVQFGVSWNGNMYARNATVEGVIRAKSGYIGYGATNKIAIGTNTTNASIYSGSHSALNSAADGFYIGADGIAIGSYNSNSGIVSCPFQVTSEGYLTARYGRIGKFTITNTYLYSGTGSNQAGMGAGTIAFWAGSNTETSAPFRISYSGDLVATKANITGTVTTSNITATGGKIGGFRISGSYLRSFATNSGTITTGTDAQAEAQATRYTLMQSSAGGGGNVAFGVATRSSTSANWDWTTYMAHNGAFIAKNATITGTVTATSFIAKNGSTTRATVDSYGLRVYNSSGTEVGRFHDSITLGFSSTNHLTIDSSSIKFSYSTNSMYTSIKGGTITIGGGVATVNIDSAIGWGSGSSWKGFELSGGDVRFRGGGFQTSSTFTGGGTVYSTGNTMCTTDNAQWCGNSTHRWKGLYLTDKGNIYSSDRKVKDILGSIDYAKNLIMGLEPVQYMWKEGDHNRKRMGFIAQDVSALCKKIGENLAFVYASYGHEGEDIDVPYYGEDVDDKLLHWGLSYEQLIAPLVQVVQDQQKEIEQLKEEVQELKNK